MNTLSNKEYSNDFVNAFPGDKSGKTHPRQTPGMLYSLVVPTPVNKPDLIGWSEDLAKELGIENPQASDIEILGGNLVTTTMQPYAACYAGHQFGNWAGQLGDGRAITLGEWPMHDGSWEIQLKGAGPTAYSRRADGRAVLRSSVREYLMSEAMYYLGVPTTRALSLVSTGDNVLRDMFYNGNAAYEPGAIVARVAPTFLRFGNFEMPASRNEFENLRKLIDWTIQRYFTEIKGEDKIVRWFGEVVKRTAKMVVEWLRVGFVHGVMNSDNMSILGLTIDYGPYSFLDNYDPDFTPNTTDLPGKRYAFGKQASIAYWNLGCLANAIAPLLKDTEPLGKVLQGYEQIFWTTYYEMMGRKLGFDKVYNEDIELITQIEKVLTEVQPDMTIFYQLLIQFPLEKVDSGLVKTHFENSFYIQPDEISLSELTKVLVAYAERIKKNNISISESAEIMRANNPRFILRNYLLHQSAEELVKGDDKLFKELQEAIKTPYSNKWDKFMVKRPGWASQKAGCSMLSCSS